MTKTERSRIVALGGIGAVIILLVWGDHRHITEKRGRQGGRSEAAL